MSDGPLAWQPLTAHEVYDLLGNVTIPWWFAGGWGIDLFVGRQTRTHEDIDVVILRKDQLVIQQYLKKWDLHKTKQPGLKPWPAGEYLTLESGVDDIWCRLTPGSPWSVQLMLMDADGGEWFHRREPRVRGPLSTLGRETAKGLPYLSPEIQLLYKAKKDALEKDEHDFAIALPLLSRGAREWLAESISVRFPEGHEWITRIRETLARR